MKLKELFSLLEVRQEDYSKGWNHLLSKYKTHPHKGLYVNFSNYRSDMIDKTFMMTPDDHPDPVGLYAYPLDYVVNHPADLQYGVDFKFARIIKDMSKNKLVFGSISESDLPKLYDKMKSITGREPYIITQHNLNPGQKFYQTLQNFTGRDNLMMTKILRQMGYDALEDTALSYRHSVFEHEPEQIVFLTRDSFKIIDTIMMVNDPTQIDISNLTQKLAFIIMKKMNEKAITHQKSETGDFIITNNGYRITITAKGEYLGLGYRDYKRSNPFQMHVKILKQGVGKLIDHTYDSDLTFDEISNDVINRFKSL